jgi:hypothetical protein
MVVLPTGSSATQDLTIRLGEFVGVVPVTIALVPDVGDPIRYDVELDASSAVDGVATFDVPIDLPINNATSVRVWTRPPPPPEE